MLLVLPSCGATNARAQSNLAEAVALVVATTSDVSAAEGLILLRGAISIANTDGVASAITFDANTVAAPRKAIALGGADVTLAGGNTLSITAPAADVEISGGDASGASFVNIDANVTLAGPIIRNGDAGSGQGGGVFNGGALTLKRRTSATKSSRVLPSGSTRGAPSAALTLAQWFANSPAVTGCELIPVIGVSDSS